MNIPTLQRPASITIPVALVLFIGGGAAGVALAKAIAPQSAVATFFGLVMLPAAFIGGLFTWLGVAPTSPVSSVQPRTVPPGAFAFVVSSLCTSILVGFALAFLSPRYGLVPAWSTVALVGAGYGSLCWFLARSGYLPFQKGS